MKEIRVTPTGGIYHQQPPTKGKLIELFKPNNEGGHDMITKFKRSLTKAPDMKHGSA